MRIKSSLDPPRRRARPSSMLLRSLSVALLTCIAHVSGARAADAPAWLHGLVSAPLPAHDDETSAVLLYSESLLTVLGPGRIKRLDRKAYRILRREGEEYGLVAASFDSLSRITAMRGWCIPASGKDYIVKERDIVEAGLPGVEGGELVVDIHTRMMKIPAATPGSTIGYEVEQELRPYTMADEWEFQERVPVREARFSLQMPPGWTHQVFWLNRSEEQPTASGAGQWNWIVHDVKPVKVEDSMPPWRGIASKMVISLQPPGTQQGGFRSWQEVGAWYDGLTQSRRDASPQIKQKVQELTASASTPLARMQALSGFVQRDIRYVAIELGIGGLQPHPATEVFDHRYGDCKDKATLLSSMLSQVGIESHYVIINTARGAVSASTPPNLGFNHAILAIVLPSGVDPVSLTASMKHPKLGNILFFDPTSTLVPFGQLPGALQANYGMLVTKDGGELLQLPLSPVEMNGVQRTAKLQLDDSGMLQGDVVERWSGDAAAAWRYELRAARQDTDEIKPVESMLSHSLATFQIMKAAVRNLKANERPFEWNYTVEVDHYSKMTGDLLLVRPRVLGSHSSGLLETREPRQHPIEFDAPERNTDTFEITLPAGYEVEDLPPPVSEDLGFVAYKSASEFKGRVLRYTRTYEIREVSVPVAKADALKRFFRVIANDERMSAVFHKGQGGSASSP